MIVSILQETGRTEANQSATGRQGKQETLGTPGTPEHNAGQERAAPVSSPKDEGLPVWTHGKGLQPGAELQKVQWRLPPAHAPTAAPSSLPSWAVHTPQHRSDVH